MKFRLILFSVIFHVFLSKSNTIDKAFSALNRKDYYTAQLLFIKASKKNTSISYFGLTQLYLKHDYLNLDSAYNCILKSEKTFATVSQKQREKFAKYNFDSLAIHNWKQTVSDAFFEIEKRNMSEIGFQNFIDKNPWSRNVENAVIFRDSIAFEFVLRIDSSSQTLNFLSKYPESVFKDRAFNLLVNQQYKETTIFGRIADFERFINEFPENSHVVDAENRIFELSTATGDLKAFREFISKYPQNRNIDEAWKQLYRIYMSDFESSKFDSFENEFPDFPFKEDFKQDKVVFLENYFPVASDQKYGYMNSNGAIVIQPQYDEVGVFRNGLAVVSKESKYGVINKKNELIVDFVYDEIVDFQDDRAIVSKEEKYNLIDRSGKEISSGKFSDLSSFHKEIYIGLEDSLYLFLDKNLNLVSDLKCQEIGDLLDGYSIVQVNNFYGVIDSNLRVRIPFQFDEIGRFENNIFIYSSSGKRGLIRSDGTKITEPIYDEIGELNIENNTTVVKSGSLISWIKIDGGNFFDFSTEYFPNALELAQFSKGYAVYRKKGKYGFVDSKGKLAFKPSLEITAKYINAIPANKNGKWGLIDFKNKMVKSFEYDLIEDFNAKGILVQKNGLSGLWDYNFVSILPLEFNSIKVFEKQYFIVTKGSKCGLYDFSGKQIIPVMYDRIQYFDKDCLILINENEITYYFSRTNHYLKLNR
jgi:hypothetical protein